MTARPIDDEVGATAVPDTVVTAPPAWLGAREPVGRPAAGRTLRIQGEETVRRLLDAGRQAFAIDGYGAARVDDIVAIAGTSHGTFYLYFRNKEDLLHRLAIECGAEMHQVTESLAALGDPITSASLEPWVLDFASAYRRHHPVIRVWLERRDLDPLMQALANDTLGELATTLQARLDPAIARRVGPSLATLGLLSLLERMSAYLEVSDGDLSDERIAATTTSMLVATFGRGHVAGAATGVDHP